MSETDHFSIECGTCLATGTTACNDCVVTHLLANDDGPIDFLTVAIDAPKRPQQRVIALFESAGLLDNPVERISLEDFESSAADGALAALAVR